MQAGTEHKKEIANLVEETLTKSVGSRGGNDMISGAENWDDIETRIDDERAQIGENDEKVREVGDGTLDPADEHALSPICAPHCDPADDLIKLMAESLLSLERCEKYCDDANANHDPELLGFFQEIRQEQRRCLNKARALVASRQAKLASGMSASHLQ